MNSAYYCKVFRNLKSDMCHKWFDLWNEQIFFIHFNYLDALLQTERFHFVKMKTFNSFALMIKTRSFCEKIILVHIKLATHYSSLFADSEETTFS